MIRMLKKNETRWSYWEAWYEETEHLYTVHYGNVGEIGDHFAVVAEQIEGRPDEVLQIWAEEMKEQGYQVMKENDFHPMIIRFPHLSESEIEMRYLIEQLLDECLGKTGNGHSDGGEDSERTLAVICRVIDTKKAAAAVFEAMSSAQLVEGISISIKQEDGNLIPLSPPA
ncbi:hypothetical protein [Brevibacillus brevis]|uniref:hypothetical protein n=1 Tax=Brevibacillus brevis TaxID=1393 RepID=UPI000D0E6325|nr:hypothetical protein [Brevibacillus brevis]PSJ66806.1 hypothetical protein C7J99_23740 [Brevibacillus brevis]RED35941.1 hypothetical protein DES34_101611 [Brevibacillus brevis]GEC88426.1 hypothetical protein BBR01nite_07570 [Brevibacillus brevis]VEF88949.1 Uncharacterised protein [Brevibacillus brevis]